MSQHFFGVTAMSWKCRDISIKFQPWLLWFDVAMMSDNVTTLINRFFNLKTNADVAEMSRH